MNMHETIIFIHIHMPTHKHIHCYVYKYIYRHTNKITHTHITNLPILLHTLFNIFLTGVNGAELLSL